LRGRILDFVVLFLRVPTFIVNFSNTPQMDLNCGLFVQSSQAGMVWCSFCNSWITVSYMLCCN